jgi:hypothetical protein
MRLRHRLFHSRLSVFNRDASDHRLRNESDNGQVSGSYSAADCTIYSWIDSRRFYGWLHVREDLPAEEKNGNDRVFKKCSHLYKRRKAHFHVSVILVYFFVILLIIFNSL